MSVEEQSFSDDFEAEEELQTFWGLKLQSGSEYVAMPRQELHLSMASVSQRVGKDAIGNIGSLDRILGIKNAIGLQIASIIFQG